MMNDTSPLPTVPGAIIGYRADGRPIRLIAGGDGTTGAGPSGTGASGDTGTGDQGDRTDTGTGDQGDDDLARLDPADLARMVRELRRENAASRTNAKQNAAEEARRQLAAELGRILNPDQGDSEETDPATLAEQLTAALEEARTLKVEREAERAARRLGADVDALLDSRRFTDQLSRLDPDSDGFTDQVRKLVADTLKQFPQYKATAGQAPARSGGDFSGGPGDAPKQFTREQIARMSLDEYAKNRSAIMAQLSRKK